MASLFLPISVSWFVGLGLELLDAHFEPPRRHGELGAQLILVGLDFRHRERREGLEPAHGEPHGARMHQRDDADHQQASDQEPDPDKHDRFDHGYASSNRIERYFYHNAMAGRALPARAKVNLNRGRCARQ